MELAVIFVSDSELVIADPAYKKEWIETDKDYLFELLWALGLNTKDSFEYQEVTTHRNRLNQVVDAGRWAGMERTDSEWIKSGNASRAAKIAASGCKLLGGELKRDLREFRNTKLVSKKDEGGEE